MRKVISSAIVALVMLHGVSASAQKFGISAGLVNSNSTTVTCNGTTNPDSEGYYAGVSWYVPLLKNLKFMPGVCYERLTSDVDDSRSGLEHFSGDDEESYIDFPFMLNYGYAPMKGFKVFAFAGPTFQYGIRSETDVKKGEFGMTADTEVDNYCEGSDYRRTDCLIGGGVGFDVKDDLLLKFAYNYGLVNRYCGSEDVTNHRSAIMVGLAVLF